MALLSLRPRVLLVDDESGALQFLDRFLRSLRADVEVVTATSGEQALDLLARETFGLVVADYRLGSMNGIDVLAEARRLQPDAPRILVSGFVEHEMIVRAINVARASAVLAKPWDAPALVRVFTSILPDLAPPADAPPVGVAGAPPAPGDEAGIFFPLLPPGPRFGELRFE